MKLHHTSLLTIITVALAGAAGCSSASNTGVQGSPSTSQPDVAGCDQATGQCGTVFTIVFENDDGANVMVPSDPFFTQLAAQQASAAAYTSATHPSLPNYIMMTSGATQGLITDADPKYNIQVPGTENLADQLDAHNIPWRAYMESMGTPCNFDSAGDYSAHHDPFLYYTTMASDPARCAEHVVDMDANFAADLASNKYRYMWITPNMCNDLHNCSSQVADAWLQKTVTQIQASPGYQNGGAIFVLFDEGSQRYLGISADLATIVASPNLDPNNGVGYVSKTAFDHRSYLATIEDIFSLGRIGTTKNVTSMDEFFTLKSGNTPPTAGPVGTPTKL